MWADAVSAIIPTREIIVELGDERPMLAAVVGLAFRAVTGQPQAVQAIDGGTVLVLQSRLQGTKAIFCQVFGAVAHEAADGEGRVWRWLRGEGECRGRVATHRAVKRDKVRG